MENNKFFFFFRGSFVTLISTSFTATKAFSWGKTLLIGRSTIAAAKISPDDPFSLVLNPKRIAISELVGSFLELQTTTF